MQFLKSPRGFWLLCALWLFLVVFAPGSVMAQCAMCRANLSGASERGARSINRAIVALIVPTVGMMAGIGLMVYRRKD